MILVYAGRRPSEEGGAFPPSREEYLTERVRRLIAGLRPDRIVGSAAAGSDVIILEVAGEFGIPATVVLGGDVESFAAESVDDKPGWRQRFDAVMQAPNTTVETLDLDGGGGDTYRAVTRRISERAAELNGALEADGSESELVGLLLSGGSRGRHDYTEDLGRQLEAAGHLVLRLDPASGRESSQVAFVAMPFGTRKDPHRGNRRYESDPTWNRLLLPALLDAGYRAVRTDLDASRQLIDSRMVLDLLGADLVVADLATHNPNVFWELGVRHTARRRGTLVVAPARVSPPFDVRAVPVQPYDRGPHDVSDRQAVDGIRRLRTAIRDTVADGRHPDVPDSPVHAAVPELTVSGLSSAAGPGARAVERIAVAGELRDVEELLAVVRDLDTADLPSASKALVRVQVGQALVRLRRHEVAVDVLRPVAEADSDYDDEQLQQLYAHALIRSVQSHDDDERLLKGEALLRLLDERHPDSGETLGLLGSAAKERALRRHQAGQSAVAELRLAADSYRQGFVADPVDYYPGVNAVALLRLLGQRVANDQTDEAAARELLPVVRFAVARQGVAVADVWAHATLGELALQAHFLLDDHGDQQLLLARQHYGQATAHAVPQQLGSMAHQLEIMLAWGDPVEVIEPILELMRARLV